MSKTMKGVILNVYDYTADAYEVKFATDDNGTGKFFVKKNKLCKAFANLPRGELKGSPIEVTINENGKVGGAKVLSGLWMKKFCKEIMNL